MRKLRSDAVRGAQRLEKERVGPAGEGKGDPCCCCCHSCVAWRFGRAFVGQGGAGSGRAAGGGGGLGAGGGGRGGGGGGRAGGGGGRPPAAGRGGGRGWGGGGGGRAREGSGRATVWAVRLLPAELEHAVSGGASPCPRCRWVSVGRWARMGLAARVYICVRVDGREGGQSAASAGLCGCPQTLSVALARIGASVCERVRALAREHVALRARVFDLGVCVRRSGSSPWGVGRERRQLPCSLAPPMQSRPFSFPVYSVPFCAQDHGEHAQ